VFKKGLRADVIKPSNRMWDMGFEIWDVGLMREASPSRNNVSSITGKVKNLRLFSKSRASL